MTSRLERLFILLESGSSGVTRRAAAKQIGEVQKLHPHELHNLLNKLIVYIQSSFWDTRIAAAQAVEAILNNVPQWDPVPLDIKSENNTISAQNESEKLTFKNFDLEKVLSNGAHLMGSEGTEFDFQDDCKGDNRERLIKQKAILDDKLGLQQMNKICLMDDILSLEDMKCELNGSNQSDTITRLMPVQDILNLESGNTSKSSQMLSCREKNRAKRKARQSNQTNVITTSSLSRKNSFNESDVEPDIKKPKMEIKNEPNVSLINDPVPDSTGSWSEATDWPFESFCSKLYIDLFSPRWETRHGAATVLRELMKSHSSGAGKSLNMLTDEMRIYHEQWLEDAALRLLCVLALDRFGDFISDQVVAPVRETCAQVLGIIFKQMSKENVCKTVDILLKLIKHDDWEVRHGGLLGIKYMLVVREDLLQMFLPLVVNDIIFGLFDSVDDVGAVAASTLIPIASWLPKFLNSTEVSNIVKMLWDLLLDQDELTSACNNFMGLLAAILSLPNASQWIQMEPMSTLIPRLWPFLSHNTSSVRKSTLQTLKTLTMNMVHSEQDVTIRQNIEKLTITNNDLANKIMHIDTKNLQIHFGVKFWPEDLLREALRHIYQRILVEPNIEIQVLIEDVWQNLIINADLSVLLHATCPYIAPWLCLAMQPSKLAFDPSLLVDTKKLIIKERKSKFCDLGSSDSSVLNQRLYLGGNETIPMDLREKNVTRARYKASKMLGLLSQFLVLPAPGVIYTEDVESPIDCYTKVLVGYLQSKSALQRLISSMVISFWAISDTSIKQWPQQLQDRIKYSLMEHVYYDEVGLSFTRLLQESRDFISTLKQYKIPVTDLDNIKVLTLDQIKLLCSIDINTHKKQYVLKPKISDLLEDRRKSLQILFSQTSHEQNSLNITTQAVIAGALICMQCLPERLNPVIKPLMESIKHEECEMLQQLSAEFLVKLLGLVINRNPSPNNKIITNLCTFLKSDTDFTPIIISYDRNIKEFDAKAVTNANPYHGILTLSQQQKMSVQRDGMYKGPGRPPLIESSEENNDSEDPTKKQNRIQRIGVTFVINAICYNFKEKLFESFPIIWNIMHGTILKLIPDSFEDEQFKNEMNIDDTNNLVTSLQLIEVAVPNISNSLNEQLFSLLPKLCVLLYHPLKAIRHMVARSIATLTLKDSKKSMEMIIDKVVPLLSIIENVIKRQGAAETLACIVDKLQYEIVPYLVLLIIPLLGRMSDPNEEVRLLCTNCFATLIQLMPLDGAIPELYQLSDELRERKKKDREFLNYLFTPKTIPDYIVPIQINAELRTYQQAGINWLWFLNKYKLHGILCDDMGLGKTLQTICLLAGDHHQRNIDNLSNLPSLVICPPTLTGHWIYEINKFLPQKFLKPLHYVGLRVDRERLRHLLNSYNILVASYDIVRKDIDFFGSVNWNYCVLDEGHIIKNGKTKSSKAIKRLIANHRLILSGTPIQNNVLELWSLFDFLMPGFLGTEKQFMCKYSRPILASRDPKSSLKEQEAGALAMEALHRQVLPFLLRRVKEDVLTDLPPKITQDLLCELSPLQERLYEDFSKTHLNSEIKDCLKNIDGQHVHRETHVFQALRYLQNVCNHPKLILNTHHPEYNTILIELAKENRTLNDIDHSAKLPVLKQLLIDCGIGNEDVSVNQHRALIFCQLKAMLDIIENDLLKKHLPAVSYLRLDGSIPASLRHHTVTQFNNDPSIDVLLLTTQVGGLGLNLTGADTVIFVEHDWNPMKDLQAMDRAHRIGQKKVVNVYRLITKNSLEEKIMGLQKFKLLTANTVVSEKNSSMETMGTDQLLDLFDFSNQSNKNDSVTKNLLNNSNNASTMKQVLQNLPELWEDKQYEEEYDLTQFLQKLKK